MADSIIPLQIMVTKYFPLIGKVLVEISSATPYVGKGGGGDIGATGDGGGADVLPDPCIMLKI